MWGTEKAFVINLHHARWMLQRKIFPLTWGPSSSLLAAAAHTNATTHKQEKRCSAVQRGETFVLQCRWHSCRPLHEMPTANVHAYHPVSRGVRRSFVHAGIVALPPATVSSPNNDFSGGCRSSNYTAFLKGKRAMGVLTVASGDTSTKPSTDAVHRKEGAGTSTRTRGASPVRQPLLRAITPSSPICLMWHRGVLELLCSSCRYVVRRWHVPVLGVDCNANPRHKQALTSPPPRSRGIPKHLTPYLVGKQAPRHPRWRQDHTTRARATHFYRARVRRNG